MASSPRRPRYFASGAQFATILVGPEEKPFVVHEALISHYSAFFKVALTGQSKEAEDKTVKLPDVDPTTFEFFSFWLYHQRFPSDAHKDSNELLDMWVGKEGSVRSREVDQLIKLYIFGDQYQVIELRRHSLDELFDLTYHGCWFPPSTEMIALAFDKLQHTSPLCRFLVDLFYLKSIESWFMPQDEGRYPDSFLLALLHRFTSYDSVIAYNIFSRGPPPQVCDYHEHSNDKEKAECGTAACGEN